MEQISEYDQAMAEMSRDLQQEIDREIIWGLLEDTGWTRIMFPTLGSRQKSVDILLWLEENCKKAYEQSGRDFIFEDPKDASHFILKWL
jgi:hypothetical protein